MKNIGDAVINSGTVTFQNDEGAEVRGTLRHFTPYLAVFELCQPSGILRSSQVLERFRIVINRRTFYSGRATVRNLILTGSSELAEATLDNSWYGSVSPGSRVDVGALRAEFGQFLQERSLVERVFPSFKLLVAEVYYYLADLRLWLDQVEVELRRCPADELPMVQRDTLQQLADETLLPLTRLFEQFETISAKIEEELRPLHQAYIRRQLHPFVLSSPFAHRAFSKPLGYAGDYEMVNMILRHPGEGESLFAKLINVWFLRHPPAEAHRNRISHLAQKIKEETLRVWASGRPARIYNLGCGPAGEVEAFLREHSLANAARFTLLDFDTETVNYTNGRLDRVRREHKRTTMIRTTKNSVAQLLKRSALCTPSEEPYDFVYCAGLFDYLPDHVCRELLQILYDFLAPGGLLLVTNVDKCNPSRQTLEHLLDWNLVYRDRGRMQHLWSAQSTPDQLSVTADLTGLNLFLEIRKPAF